jgi:Putative transposase of IS4/5 family (DUF4096)
LPDRVCLTGILFVLRSGIPWEMLSQELGYGSGMTCWRRLRDWQEARIWQLMHFVLLDWLARYERIDWSRAVVDGSSVRAVFGVADGTEPYRPGQAGQQAPSDLRRTGSSRPFDSPEPIVTTHSKPSHWLMLSQACRESGDAHAIVLIAYWATVAITLSQSGNVCAPDASSLFLRSETHGSGLGRWRWVVERTFAK